MVYIINTLVLKELIVYTFLVSQMFLDNLGSMITKGQFCTSYITNYIFQLEKI